MDRLTRHVHRSRREDEYEEMQTETARQRRRTSSVTNYEETFYVELDQQREPPTGAEIDPDAAPMRPISPLLPKQLPRHSGDRRAGPDA